MAKRIEFEGAIHEFPDDFTDADITKALSPARASTAGGPPAVPRRRPFPGYNELAGALPFLGGLGGGAAGMALGSAAGPLGAAGVGFGGATTGGALGEYGREKMLGMEPSPSQIGQQGLLQGLYDLIGQGVMLPLTRGTSRGLMRSALKPSKGTQQAAVQVAERQSGKQLAPSEAQLADQALKQGVGVTTGGLKKLRASSESAANRLNIALSGSNERFSFHHALKDIDALKRDVRMQTDAREALGVLRDQIKSFITSPTRGGKEVAPNRYRGGKKVDALTFNDWKRTWQKAAEAIYSMEKKGGTPGPRQQMGARFNENVAGSARRALERIPGVAEANRALERNRPLEDAILDALYRNTGQTVTAAPPALSMVIPGFIRSPQNLSRLALLLNSPFVQGASYVGPRAVGSAMLGGEMPPEDTNRR